MDDLYSTLMAFLEKLLTSILSTMLISIGLFCASWYFMTSEFPPNMHHVKEKWAQYQQMIKLSEEAMAKMQARSDQDSDSTSNQQILGMLAQAQNPQGQLPAVNITQAQWTDLQQRLQRLENEMKILQQNHPAK